MPLPLTVLAESNTFRTWYERTNELIAVFNSGLAVAANVVANGAFVIGLTSSLSVANTFIANSSTLLLRANTNLAANLTVNSSANVVNFAPGSLILQPINGTMVNTALTVNATSLFQQPAFINATSTVNGAATFNSTLTTNGLATFTSISARLILLNHANAAVANSMADLTYNDFAPTGLTTAAILNLTPAANLVVTGIVAPIITAGARVLHIQNLSTTAKISFPSGNTSSVANNRFKMVDDSTFELQPGSAASFIWAFDTLRWRPLSAAAITGAQTFGNTTINGTLSVTGNVAMPANATVGRVTSNSVVTANSLVTLLLTATGNTSLTANLTASANAVFSAVTKVTGASARLVIPVGTNLWAT